MTPRASPFRLVLILALALVATCAIPPDPAGAQDRAQDLRTLRAELVALDDSIARTERHLAELTLATACMQALPPLAPVAHLRRCLGEPPTAIADESRRTVMVASAAIAVPILNAAFQVDRDLGGYPDRAFTTDKFAHFGLAYAATSACTELGVRRWTCFALTNLGGVGWEFSQGKVSGLDLGANALGSASRLLVSHLAERWRGP